jgi:NAD(P)-dependent dehydrogenase (short-subunit alcohol dehydrogenase family)
MTQSLQGTRALVVGASAGIGREIGLRLASHGAEVAFHGRRRDRLADAVREAGSGCAVSDVGDASRALSSPTVAHLGRIDLLVLRQRLAARAHRGHTGREWAVCSPQRDRPALVMPRSPTCHRRRSRRSSPPRPSGHRTTA